MNPIQTAQATEPALIDVKAVAALLGCSTRHVTRLEEAKQMPPSIKLGRLSRWNRTAIEEWIAAGAPPPRSPATGSPRRSRTRCRCRYLVFRARTQAPKGCGKAERV